MDEAYTKYLMGKWNEAEDISLKLLGRSSNDVVITVFKMICQPYFYWKKEKD